MITNTNHSWLGDLLTPSKHGGQMDRSRLTSTDHDHSSGKFHSQNATLKILTIRNQGNWPVPWTANKPLIYSFQTQLQIADSGGNKGNIIWIMVLMYNKIISHKISATRDTWDVWMCPKPFGNRYINHWIFFIRTWKKLSRGNCYTTDSQTHTYIYKDKNVENYLIVS